MSGEDQGQTKGPSNETQRVSSKPHKHLYVKHDVPNTWICVICGKLRSPLIDYKSLGLEEVFSFYEET